MKKLNFRIILIQFIGIIFLINGILQLRFYTAAEKIIYIRKHFGHTKTGVRDPLFPAEADISDFWSSVYVWIFPGMILGICLVSYINWKNKLSALNNIIIALCLYMVLRFKFFRKGILSDVFHPFTATLSDNPTVQFFIEGIIFTFIGSIILYSSVYLNLFYAKKNAVSN
jgi:hypothetical protein